MSGAPCPSCPWRRDQDQWAIPGFNLEKARGLADTVGDGDAFRKVMSCHGSLEVAPKICAGYAYRHGWSNLNVRMLVMRDGLDMKAIINACRGLDLHLSYEEMMEKLEASA